ncbi:hypothetical protein TEA_016849 [Camellia sinensis var. sinensis]|uniref:Uncharacterized protein n=1 Tax=Camellia sinensis var. sinensis TaxID=542762 RepID=A0A4S4D011_CAMSN|nr:hypothetical protein TEA_016849 [Camellia sinensis var. sinensis]
MPMILTVVKVALFAKLLMMYDESKSQEMIERKIEHAPAGQDTVRMLTREEWEEIKEVRPRTPFESKLARPNARRRTGEPLHKVKLNSRVLPLMKVEGIEPIFYNANSLIVVMDAFEFYVPSCLLFNICFVFSQILDIGSFCASRRQSSQAFLSKEVTTNLTIGAMLSLLLWGEQMHTLSRDDPSETLKRKVAELEKMRKMKNPRKNQLFVQVPEPKTFLDTATMPMILTAVGVALFAKLLMMYDESKSQEMIERKIEHAPAGQGTVRMLTREEWEEIKEVRPRTPFESKLACPNARIRTGEQLHKVKLNSRDDLKDWTIDVLTDALTRAEETVRHRPK